MAYLMEAKEYVCATVRDLRSATSVAVQHFQHFQVHSNKMFLSQAGFRIDGLPSSCSSSSKLTSVSPQGSQSVRESMLRDILLQCSNMTAPELELQFCDCASLFLARLTAWLRLT